MLQPYKQFNDQNLCHYKSRKKANSPSVIDFFVLCQNIKTLKQLLRHHLIPLGHMNAEMARVIETE